MMNKFDILFEQVMNDLKQISSKRKPMLKIEQMTTKQFLDFLRDIIPLFKNGELDYDNVSITEKIDGEAYRIVVLDDDVLFENSKGRITPAERSSFSYKAIYIKEKLKKGLVNLSHKIGANFKIIGELIWCKDVTENGKITPVGASYLAEKFGTFGSMVIFDIKKIDNNELIDFEEDEESTILESLKTFNDDEFSFFDRSDITLSRDNVKFNLNVEELSELLASPEFNKESYSKKTDADTLNKIKEIREDIESQIESIINATTGKFSKEGDLIEGIVLRNLSNGNQYGMFSNNYKEMKHGYSYNLENRDALLSEFKKKVFGYALDWMIVKNWASIDKEAAKQKFDEEWPGFISRYEEIYDTLVKDDSIPKSTKTTQTIIIGKSLEAMKKVTSFEEYVKNVLRIR